jgi:hypothetical protein
VYTDFETGLDGWEAMIYTDGRTGEFVVDAPSGTFLGGPAQPAAAAQGNQCLFTGRNPNGQISRSDVSYGEVTALSPIFDASSMAAVELELWRWFFIYRLGLDANDYFAIDVSTDGGGTWTNVEFLGNSDSGYNAWNQVSYRLHRLVPLTDTMRLRFRASDGLAQWNYLEAAIDQVHVYGPNACTSSLVFEDGLETGDTSLWSSTIP